MLVLGETADDKGAQLESLVGAVLQQQGYKRVRLNVVGAGANELDITAERESTVVSSVQVTPIIGEAKAYGRPVSMPTWHGFLGKLFIERRKDPTTVGVLVALNGVNGNVAGSLKSLEGSDTALFVIEGRDLEDHARAAGELADEPTVRQLAIEQFGRTPQRIDTAYYGGIYYYVVWWKHEGEYSTVGARGELLPVEDVEGLRPALEATLPGSLLASEEATVEAQERHNRRIDVLGKLFRGHRVPVAEDSEFADALAALADEPFCRVVDGDLELLPANELDDASVSRLFVSIFENMVQVRRLSFVADGHHTPYVGRLVAAIPGLHGGFALSEDEEASLGDIAPLFPSIWARLAVGNPFIASHRGEGHLVDERVLETDRTAFWESMVEAIRSDYSNQGLRGFLYDYMGVAELEERNQLIVKGKLGPVGLPIQTEMRTAVRQFVDESAPPLDRPVYITVRILPDISEPWEDDHPPPEFPLAD